MENKLGSSASGAGDFVNVQINIRDLLAQVAKNNPKMYMEYITDDMGNAIVKTWQHMQEANAVKNPETDKGVN